MLGYELELFYLFLADFLVGRGSFGTATAFGSFRGWRPRLFVCVDSGDDGVRPGAAFLNARFGACFFFCTDLDRLDSTRSPPTGG